MSQLPVKRLFGAVIILASVIAAYLYSLIMRRFFPHGGFLLPADLECFRANGAYLGRHIADTVAMTNQVCVFKYPPTFLLLAVPLSWLPPLPDFILWSLVSVMFLVLTGRVLGLGWRGIGLALLAPPVMLCLTIGQNGIFLSLALLFALVWAEGAPLAAGAIAGLLVAKPQLGLLLPICYLAARNWRAFGAAAASSVLLCLLSAALFGTGVWRDYLLHGAAVSSQALNAPWPQNYQHILVSPFILVRAWGGDMHAAYTVQILSSLAAAVAAWRLWSAPRPHPARLALTLCLAALITPYSYLYDLPALSLALVALAAQTGWRRLGVLAWFWSFTSLYIFVATFFVPLGAPCVALMLPALWRRSAGDMP